jgi:hypothetical protein
MWLLCHMAAEGHVLVDNEALISQAIAFKRPSNWENI